MRRRSRGRIRRGGRRSYGRRPIRARRRRSGAARGMFGRVGSRM